MRQIELAVRPVPRGVRPAEGPMVTAPPPGGAMEASTSTVAAPAPAAPDGDKPMVVMAPPPEPDAALWRSPHLAYEDQVREALIGAMLDWGALLPLGPDEWLTGRRARQPGRGHAWRRAGRGDYYPPRQGQRSRRAPLGRLPTDELRRRVEVREF